MGMPSRPVTLSFMVVVIVAAIVVLWKALPAEKHSESPVSESEASPDDHLRRLLIGTWEDDYQGKRTMTLQEGGTGTMIVELSGWRATLSAPRLRFDLVWSVEGGHLKKRTIGGEPETQVQMILKTMGDRVDEPILELTEMHLDLLDGDGKTKYHWSRVEKGPSR